MEVTVTDFRNNMSTYFDKAYFEKEDIILKRRWYKLKITADFTEEIEDEKIFDSAVRSDVIRSKLSTLASKL